MKTSCFKLIQLTMLIGLAFTQVGCDNAEFSSSGSDNSKVTTNDVDPENPTDTPEDLIFLDDSYERDDIFIDLANNIIYGWRGFILDGANAVLNFQSNGAGARIPQAGELGVAADGQRFLLLNGRDNDAAVETVHVVSQSYDLSQYNTVLLTLRYLTFNLNDADDTVPENLKVQVCRGTLNECGANDDGTNATGLQSDKWVTVYTNSQNINDDAFNGKNHAAVDWQTGLVAIDLRDLQVVGNASTFVFRFVATMKDGVNPGTCTEVEDCEYAHNHKHEASRAVATSSSHDEKDHKNCDHKKDKCKHKDCKDKKKCDHKCKDKNCKHKCKDHGCKKKKCCKKKQVCQDSDGTLKDGVAIDKVVGRATALTIEEIF